ncbi:MAG: hypothetical protein RLZZ314_219 [Bacteroidota bacterium]|jgi:predicted nuclease with TOPRIM domain
MATHSQIGSGQTLITRRAVVSPGNFKDYLSTMEAILEKQLQEALAERRAVMGEFLRLKAELVRAQQRNDDLRSENKALREALHAAEHEVTNLFSYATQLGGAAS